MEQRCAARSRAAGNWPKSGKKRWQFRLSLDAMPAFVRVCEDSVAEGLPPCTLNRNKLRVSLVASCGIMRSERVRSEHAQVRGRVAGDHAHPDRCPVHTPDEGN